MSVGWGSRKRKPPRDEVATTPSTPYILSGISVEPSEDKGVSISWVVLWVDPDANPDTLQEDDVIEPTRVFKPWIAHSEWDACIIDTRTDET